MRFRRKHSINVDLFFEEEKYIGEYGYYGHLQSFSTVETLKERYNVTIATSNWEDYFRKVLPNPMPQAYIAQPGIVDHSTDGQGDVNTEQGVANVQTDLSGHGGVDTDRDWALYSLQTPTPTHNTMLPTGDGSGSVQMDGESVE
jgi:hypothetical protein